MNSSDFCVESQLFGTRDSPYTEDRPGALEVAQIPTVSCWIEGVLLSHLGLRNKVRTDMKQTFKPSEMPWPFKVGPLLIWLSSLVFFVQNGV
jgi:hypothetical protein